MAVRSLWMYGRPIRSQRALESSPTLRVEILSSYKSRFSVTEFISSLALQVSWVDGSQQLSFDEHATVFTVSPIPSGADIAGYRILFRVSAESNPSVITPTNATQNSSAGEYRSGAYIIP
jgi:hypothetical protein